MRKRKKMEVFCLENLEKKFVELHRETSIGRV